LILLRKAPEGDRTYSEVHATDTKGSAHWEAKYNSPLKPERRVHNIIDAYFEFTPDHKIQRHVDHFDFAEWSRQAMGFPGYLCGCCPCFQALVQSQTASKLAAYIEKHPEFQDSMAAI
jgi:hypothetical protein